MHLHSRLLKKVFVIKTKVRESYTDTYALNYHEAESNILFYIFIKKDMILLICKNKTITYY